MKCKKSQQPKNNQDCGDNPKHFFSRFLKSTRNYTLACIVDGSFRRRKARKPVAARPTSRSDMDPGSGTVATAGVTASNRLLLPMSGVVSLPLLPSPFLSHDVSVWGTKRRRSNDLNSLKLARWAVDKSFSSPAYGIPLAKAGIAEIRTDAPIIKSGLNFMLFPPSASNECLVHVEYYVRRRTASVLLRTYATIRYLFGRPEKDFPTYLRRCAKQDSQAFCAALR
jgi:hypothetical protein